MSFLELAWKVVPPVVSGAVGVAGTLYKLTKSLDERVKKLEDIRVRDLENHNSSFSTKYKEDVAGLKALIDELKKEIDKEVEDLYSELRGRARERLDGRRLQTKLSERYLALEGRVENCEKAINNLNESFVQFSKGQQEQWQEINRVLGTIEGWLRATTTRNSGSFPGSR